MKILTPILFVTLFALFFGCESQPTAVESSRTKPKVSSEVAMNETPPAAENNNQEFVIDVRTQEEWDEGHIANAIHIPHEEVGERIGEVTTDKAAKLVLY